MLLLRRKYIFGTTANQAASITSEKVEEEYLNSPKEEIPFTANDSLLLIRINKDPIRTCTEKLVFSLLTPLRPPSKLFLDSQVNPPPLSQFFQSIAKLT